MTQFIESTPGTIAAAMQQSGTNYSQMPMQQGFAEGGLASLPRGGYMGGGRTIGGGSFTGIPMGNRTGFGLLKKLKKTVKKLIPKELAGIMQVAAPFIAPHSLIGAGLMSGLGQYKSRGKISPLQLMMSMAPGVQGRHLSNIGLNKAGTIGPKENVLRNLMNRTNTGTKVDQWLFGKEAGMPKTWDVGKAGMPTSTTWSPATQGVLGKGGEYGGIKDIVSRGAEKIFMKGPENARELDKTAVLSAALAGLSYWEAKEQIQLQNGIDLEKDLGITEDVWESTDWSQAFANDATYLQGNAKGGIPRTRYAMAQGGRIGYSGGGSYDPGARWSYLINKFNNNEPMTEDEIKEMEMLEISYADESKGNAKGGIPRTRYAMAQGGRIGYRNGNDVDPDDPGHEGEPLIIPDDADISPDDFYGKKEKPSNIMMASSKSSQYYVDMYMKYAQDMINDGNQPMSIEDFVKIIKELERTGNAQGGIPRTRYAMGTSQFPMTSTRGMYANGGMTWGSDQGEGLGGQEVEADMRYEGGFMPYGEEPKADDVPARLSKDEFVFTDEAVAGAGDGDVEVGAERLYKVMKSLEQGGRLSEESQGEGIGAMI